MIANKKIKLDILIFLIVLTVIIFTGVVPLVSDFSKNSENLSNRKKDLFFLEQQISALQDFQNNSAFYQPSVQKLNSSFVSQEAPIEFIEFLEEEAQKQQLDISISSVKDESEEKGTRFTMAFQVSLSGDFPEVLIFLQRIEQSPWLLKIDQASVQRVGEKEKLYNAKSAQAGQVVLVLSFKTFSNYLGPRID
ncbi:MAG: hypothetical protein PHE77_02615 [Candidatus Pacebacteria bacterium]|nr:hypothetical protein [Candidatus Paceibacterota bacterium]